MNWLETRVPPPLVALITAALMWQVAPLSEGLIWQGSPRYALTFCLIVIGITFDFSGLLGFLAARTTINPLQPARSRALVTHGVYRYTRNPMYVGMVCLLLAWATYLGSLWALMLIPIFMLYLQRFQIEPEERALERLFGDAFLQYRQRVRRWL